MKPSQDGPWLKLPLESTPLSKEFTETANRNGYKTIGEVLAIPLTRLSGVDWFTPEMVQELAELVKSFRKASEDHV